jgi:hypothetical protein
MAFCIVAGIAESLDSSMLRRSSRVEWCGGGSGGMVW